jgi:uncharacterized membrane protein
MEKRKILLVLLISIISFSSIYLIGTRISGMFIGFGQPAGEFKWWNVSWHYRVRLEINSTYYNRTDWPIEQVINFTDLLPSGTFDENSTRVFEYNSTGSILYEVPNQFDKDDNYNAISNARGIIVFLINGTTQSNAKRIFYVYYDKVENGIKENKSYTNSLSYNYSDGEFSVNTSTLYFWIDTLRGENTSGLYKVIGVLSGNPIWIAPGSDQRTIEYMQYSNETNNFSFDFSNNATLKYSGPIRIVVEQRGNETLWNSTNITEGFAVKRYTFYDKTQWIKIETIFTNIGSNSITRNSTFAGALTIDAKRAFEPNPSLPWQSNMGNTTQPGWWYASDYNSNFHSGIVYINQTGTSNFWVPNSSSMDKIGIQLNSTSISSGSSISEVAAIHFNDMEGNPNQVKDLRNRFETLINISQSLPERWYTITTPSTNATIYNRNESMLIAGNVSLNDPYNLTKYMNATLDMGTVSQADDQIIILYDDGTHGDTIADDKIFTNSFSIQNDATTGLWTINFTTYSNNSEFLNSTDLNFNVTDILNVTVNTTNKKPLTNSILVSNVYVKNYRQDGWISGATINCTYASTEVINKTDYNNGTYSVNFTVPSQEGSYILYCNATKNQNFGNNSDSFTAESAKTIVSITATPQNPYISNITLYQNDSFSIITNATNIANGTAYVSNISLELLSGWNANTSLEQCGDIEKNSYCIKSFNVIVPNNTPPGNYYINATVFWRNPDGTSASNKSEVNVTIASNPKLIVEESAVSSEAGDGTWNYIGNFTVSSIGNDQLLNVTFSCYSGVACNDFNVNFTPINISTLAVGLKQNVSINISIPLGYANGNYNGDVNVSAQNDNFDTFILNVTIPAKTNVSTVTSISNYIAYNITQQSSETFEFKANATNMENSSARSVNMSLSLPSSWTSNSSLEYCGNLNKSNVCSIGFNITIPNGTLAGNYLINVSSNWTNNDNSFGTNKTYINVTVSPNPLINISETNISGIVLDGRTQDIGNFTVFSIGNDALQNIAFNCYQGIVCQNFNVSFNPSSIAGLGVNLNQTVIVNVSVPLGFLAGAYNGTINASTQNDNYKNLTLLITVPSNRTWTMVPNACQRSEYPDEGTVCEVQVRNLGNDIINFTISPSEVNHTKVNVTTFYVNVASNYTFNVSYNVTNVTQSTYNSLYFVDAVQSDSIPGNMTLNISLLPYLPPIINFTIVPNSTEQNSSVEIFANITDRSSSGILWTNISVTRPDGTTNQSSMTLINQSGNFSQWYFIYPSSIGNTTLRGFYNVWVSSQDSIGNLGNLTKNFSVYTKLLITSTTLSSTYLQGDTGSIYHFVRNMSGSGLNDTNVTFTITSSTNNVSYYTEQRTNSEGTISPMPSFTLATDAATGNYTLFSNSSFYDSIAGVLISKQVNRTFLVNPRTVTVTGLFADIETAVVWYPNNTMRIGILVYNGEGRPVDPTDMNLTVYDPDNIPFISINMSQMTKRATGYYTYQRTLSQVTPSGMYLAVLSVSQDTFQTMKLKAFRVAHGGPYDVWINLFENEVPQGDSLDFAINIENKGEVTQDVIVDYWVSSQNTTYYSNLGQAVLTPELSNQSFTRYAYIYPSQPLGTYILNVRVSYDTLQQPITNSVTFSVITKTTPQIPPSNQTPETIYVTAPTPTGGTITVTTPTERISASILITTYNSNISLARNFTKIESVIVKNNGIVDLNNVSLLVLGIPLDWFKVVPESYATLHPENSSIFLIEFNIPKNAKVDEYKASLIATSGIVSDQKSITIKIYQSLEELLKNDIKKYKEELQDLYIDIKIAEKEGKDVSTALGLFNQAKTKVDSAEQDLEDNKTEDALDKLSTVPKLIRRAKDLLDSLEKPKEEGISIWIILIAFLGIIAAVIIIVLVWKRKKITKLRPYIISLGRVAEIVKKKKISKEDMEVERDKLTRMLKVLEKEKEQGIITGNSYDKMKKSIEEKLSKLEKK